MLACLLACLLDCSLGCLFDDDNNDDNDEDDDGDDDGDDDDEDDVHILFSFTIQLCFDCDDAPCMRCKLKSVAASDAEKLWKPRKNFDARNFCCCKRRALRCKLLSGLWPSGPLYTTSPRPPGT